jgi:hypothetical protein
VSEAEELWEALDLKPGDQVVEAVLIGKLVNFETGRTVISLAATDGVDWVSQGGLLWAAQRVVDEAPIHGDDDG